MSKSGADWAPSLLRLITLRIFAVAVLAVLLQIGVVAFDYYLDENELAGSFVRRETEALAAGLEINEQQVRFAPPPVFARLLKDFGEAYAFRVLDSSGAVIAAHQASLLEKKSPWVAGEVSATDSWLSRDVTLPSMGVAGGETFNVDGQIVRVEIATLGDPAGLYWRVLFHETTDHVWLPMIPMFLLVLIVTTLSVRKALAPVVQAAEDADAIDPRNPIGRFDARAMPREVAGFARAINRTLERVRDLVGSQKLFLASAAHELRTPLAVMMLELGQIDHPRARRLEKDVSDMSDRVNQLLTIASLDAAGRPDFVAIDLGEIAREVADRLELLAETEDKQLKLEIHEPDAVEGNRSALADALRNLVENAIKHTPKGTVILISAGPGSRLQVDDSGSGLDNRDIERLCAPFQKGRHAQGGVGLGLSIAKQIAELHGGKLLVSRSSLGGARFRLELPPTHATPAHLA